MYEGNLGTVTWIMLHKFVQKQFDEMFRHVRHNTSVSDQSSSGCVDCVI